MIRIPADDLPYGPGNTDYEYDGWRQERDDELWRDGVHKQGIAPDSPGSDPGVPYRTANST